MVVGFVPILDSFLDVKANLMNTIIAVLGNEGDSRATMAIVVTFDPSPSAGRPKSQRATFFNRHELSQLLSLYSTRVARGEWRDYALDHQQGQAIFSVFRHTMESPRFSIVKAVSQGGKKQEYAVFAGKRRLSRSSNLSDALRIFDKELVVIG